MYKRLISVVLLLAFVAISGYKASAAPVAQAAACTDATFMSGLGKDLTDMGEKFKATDVKDVVATSQTFLAIAGLRQKYEDMTVANECIDIQFETILAFGNASDILALVLASQTDTANAEIYTKVIPDQLKRFEQMTQGVLVVAGIATPAAGATAGGRISAISSTTCADADFQTALGKDLQTIGSTLSATDMTNMGAISQTVLSTIALRQKYEDVKAPSGCELTQLTTVIALANVTDLLGLGLAAKADTANADTYKKALDGQSTRTQDLLKKIATAAGAPEPAATEAK